VTPRGRLLAALISLAALFVVIWPVGWSRREDSFPLSNYPMFSRRRPSPVLDAVYAVALGPGGERRPVPPALVANGEVLQARAAYDRARARGARGQRELCGAIATRIAASGALPGAGKIELVHGRHDAVRYFAEGALGAERRLVVCAVPGRAEVTR
jgi:hypothetical protein